MAVVDPLLASFSEAPVTPEMIVAGFHATGLDDQTRSTRSDEMICDIYRAMHAVAPVEVVSEGERVAVKERDEARAEIERLRLDWLAASRHSTEAVECLTQAAAERERRITALEADNETLTAQLAARDARIAELKTILAQRPAAVPLGTRPHASDCAVHNEPAYRAGPCDCGAMDKPHNPFRTFPGDRRRVGS